MHRSELLLACFLTVIVWNFLYVSPKYEALSDFCRDK